MYLESLVHDQNAFVTLTYGPEHSPADGSLDPGHTQKWLKRLRKAVQPRKIRYYLAGEYGDLNGRPHYHAILFGLGPADSNIVQSTWGMGHTLTVECNQFTIQYTCGYIVKKLTRAGDPRLEGRYPEFARQSNRPGIGAPAVPVLAEAIATDAGYRELLTTRDVPTYLLVGGKKVPLGPYLRQKLREEIGMPDDWNKEAKEAFVLQKSTELSALLNRSLADPETVSRYKSLGKAVTASSVLAEENKGAIQSIEARSKIQKGKTL